MLARYQIIRGKRPDGHPLPDGRRVDIRKHTRHVLHPNPEHVRAYLARPSLETFRTFARAYEAELERRFASDPRPFHELCEAARTSDVYIGCNCPTRANPHVERCHSLLALAFMKRKYPRLKVVMPR